MEQDYRFGGIQRLYGDEAFQCLQNSHVGVVGLGGVGSWTVEALARSGVGSLTLMDFDNICVSNTNRQLHALQGSIGKMKTQALKERALLINPEIQINILDEPFAKETQAALFEKSLDAVVDAIDHGPTKLEMVLGCKERNLPLVISGAAGGRLDFSKIKTGDLNHSKEDPMLASLRKNLRQKWNFPRTGSMGLSCVYSTEKPTFFTESGELTKTKPERRKKPLDCSTGMGTVTHVTGSFGFALAHLALQKLVPS